MLNATEYCLSSVFLLARSFFFPWIDCVLMMLVCLSVCLSVSMTICNPLKNRCPLIVQSRWPRYEGEGLKEKKLVVQTLLMTMLVEFLNFQSNILVLFSHCLPVSLWWLSLEQATETQSTRGPLKKYCSPLFLENASPDPGTRFLLSDHLRKERKKVTWDAEP